KHDCWTTAAELSRAPALYIVAPLFRPERIRPRWETFVAAFLVIGLALCLLPTPSSTGFVFHFPFEAQDRAQSRRRPAARKKAPSIYANFSHTTHVTKQKLACDSCHKVPTSNWKEVRQGDAAFPDVVEFPDHSSCLNCHRQQFFARERPAPA